MTLTPVEWNPYLRGSRHNTPELMPALPVVREFQGDWHPVLVVLQLVGNVVLFIPFGMLVPALVPKLRRGWRVILAGAGVSALIELWQLTVPQARHSDVNDVLTNTLGVAIGWGIMTGLQARARRRGGDPGALQDGMPGRLSMGVTDSRDELPIQQPSQR